MTVIDKKKAMTAGVTLFIAAAAGYFMQNGAPLPGGAPLSETVLVSAAVPTQTGTALPTMDVPLDAPVPETPPNITIPEATMVSSTPVTPLAPTVADRDAPDVALVSGETETSDTPLSEPVLPLCEAGMTATSRPAALVSLTLESPCHAGEQVELSHEGLRITERLDDKGMVRVDLPAMNENAVFTARFRDGSKTMAEIFVPTVGDYERVALIWKGVTGLGLHALATGATYGEPGHIHAGHPSTPDQASTGKGGFMSVAGSIRGGWNGDIYTYPISLIDAGQSPEISVEAEVLAEACDMGYTATLLHVSPRYGASRAELAFGAPGCDAVGEFLVLKNLPQDLKIASN